METTPLLEQVIDTEQVYSLLLYSFILRPYQILKLTHYKVIYKELSENRFVYITAPSEDWFSFVALLHLWSDAKPQFVTCNCTSQ